MNLTEKKCVPCEGSALPLTVAQVAKLLPEVSGWNADAAYHQIQREFSFHDFKRALAFVNKVGALAESEGHHPDIAIRYNRITLTLWTHAIKGLSENDFILAAKINALS